MSNRLLVSALAIAMAGLANLAQAAPTTFFGEDVNTSGDPVRPPPTNSDAARAAFFAHLNGVGTESFESYEIDEQSALPVVFPGAGVATFVGGWVKGNDNIAGRYPTSGEKYLDSETLLSVNFSAPVAAFGFYATDVGDFGDQLILRLTDTADNVTQLIVPATSGMDSSTTGSVLYFGFYDLAASYKSIVFGNNDLGDFIGIDDVSAASRAQVVPSAVPEPSLWAMMIAGFGLIGWALRRARRPAAQLLRPIAPILR